MKKNYIIISFFLLIFLIVTCLISLSIGSASISLKNVLNILINANSNSTECSIIFDIRIPRILLGIFIGGGLSLAGVILQGLLRNPLVEPYTLGISGGSAFFVCLSISFGLNKYFEYANPIFGFLGGVTILLLIYYLNISKNLVKTNGILLTGVILSFIFSSLVMLIMSLSKADDLTGMIFWIMGSLDEPNTFLIKIMIFVSVSCLISAYFYCNDLNALILGDDEAKNLGINVFKSKKILFLIAAFITGVSVSVSGVIGFVGLLIPHILKIIVGNDYRILLISSYLSGAIFLVCSDTIARTIIQPLELPVGVITGIIGGIMFIIIFYNKEKNNA